VYSGGDVHVLGATESHPQMYWLLALTVNQIDVVDVAAALPVRPLVAQPVDDVKT